MTANLPVSSPAGGPLDRKSSGLALRATASTLLVPSVALRAETAVVTGIDRAQRLITGRVVPYGVGGRTNLGHGVSVRAGAVRFREPHRRVIGVYGHTNPEGTPYPWPHGTSVARMVAVEDTASELNMRFRVPRTPLGDQLLAEADPAEGGTRSSLSIELTDVQVDPWSGDIVSGLCEFVAFVPLGAYDDAQVTSVAASAHPNNPGDSDVRVRLTRSAFGREFITVGGGGQPGQPVPQVVAPAQGQAPAQVVNYAAPVPNYAAPAAPAPPAPAQGAPQPGPGLQAQPGQPAPQGQQIDPAAFWAAVQAFGLAPRQPGAQPGGDPAPLAQLQAQPGGPAQAPGGLQTDSLPQGQTGPRQAGAVRRMAQLQAQLANPQAAANPQLRAALADITNSGLDLFQNPAGAVGEELWSGGTYTRRFVPLMTPRQLTSWKFTGWRWVQKPKVQDYDGDKAEIPTNPVSVEPAGGEAERCAGGWDVDRKFRDFGDAAFWEGFYQAQTESYLELSDQRAAAAIVAAARDITVDANVPAGYTDINVSQAGETRVLKAAALGGAILEDTPNVRRSADYVVMNTSDWLTLMNLAQLDLPAFLGLLGVKPEAFLRSPLVPAGTVILGVKPATSFYELGSTPIRVEALDVARAGIDSAVYGYTGSLVNRPGGVIKVPLTAPV